VLSEDTVRNLVAQFGVILPAPQAAQVLTYLDLLIRWNRRINLTSVPTPEECVTRHFGESLYLAKVLEIQGRLLDVGSGAGFPGLALKILFPNLSVTLLEPVAKKRAFLKEVARACDFDRVEVRGERLDKFANETTRSSFDASTARAVGWLEHLIPMSTQCLKTGGFQCLWLSMEQISEARGVKAPIKWSQANPIPLSSQRVILVGSRT
jgi:16S rRNA (guanine527-N7)-methyltransferase